VSVPDVDGGSPVARWEKTFTPEALRQAFQEIGGAITIQPLERSKTGRVRRAKVIGPGGELVLSGGALRERLGLRSTLVTFRFEPAGRDGGAEATPPTLPPPPPVDQDEAQAARAGVVAPSAPSPVATLLPSTSGLRLVVEGRGFGHGVGLSLWGAYALALRGKSHGDILRHYYRGAELRTW